MSQIPPSESPAHHHHAVQFYGTEKSLFVTVLCGYAMGSFYKQTRQLEEVCRQHAHVIPNDSNVFQFPPVRTA